MMFEGIDNFRDFGGFAIDGGRTVKLGRLLRSAHLAKATDADLARLSDLPVSAVVDLRRPTERREAPFPRRGVLDLDPIVCDVGDMEVGPHIEFLRRGDVRAEAVEAFLINYYRKAPFAPAHLELFGQAFRALLSTDGAVLIHCAAGKDRTGLLVALIRTALGGAWDETVNDYLSTNRANLTAEKRAVATVFLSEVLGCEPEEAAIRALLGVEARHLEAAFESIRERYGSVEAYLAALGIDEPTRRRLADRLAM